MKRKFINIITLIVTICFVNSGWAYNSINLEKIRGEADKQANSFTVENQDHSTVAMNISGEIFSTWNSHGNRDNSGSAVCARTITEGLSAISDEFILNQTTIGNQLVPDVAAASTDLFCATYSSDAKAGYDVFVTCYSIDDQTVKIEEIKLNTTPSTKMIWPDIAMNDHYFIVVWDHVDGNRLNYYASVYSLSGEEIIGEKKINRLQYDEPYIYSSGLPDIDVNATGEGFITWENFNSEGVTIVGCPFTLNANKKTIEQEELISQPTSSAIIDQRRPMVDINGHGDVVISWAEGENGDSNSAVYFMKYDNSLKSWGPKVCPHEDAIENDLAQHRSIAKLTDTGEVVIAWTSDTYHSEDDIFMRFYDNNNESISDVIQINNTVAGNQCRPAIDWLKKNNTNSNIWRMIVSWDGQDDDMSGVFLQVYNVEFCNE